MKISKTNPNENLENKLGINLIINIIEDDKSKGKILTKNGSEGSWYKEFKKAFPIDDERETPKGFIEVLEESKKSPKSRGYIIHSLEAEDKGKDRVIGGSVTNRLTSDDYTVAVWEYVFIDKGYRRKGLGKLLAKAQLDEVKRQADNLGSKFVATLAETENPEKMSSKNIKKNEMNLKTGREILKREGYKVVDFPYVQLPLNKSLGHIYHFDLLIRPIDERKDEWKYYIPSKDLKKMLSMYCKTFSENFESDIEYMKMMDCLSKRERIPLKPLY